MFVNMVTFLVILLLIFINGITDASNAVATVIGTKVLSYRKACILSALMNAVGVTMMFRYNQSITSTVSEMVRLPQTKLGLSIICIAMLTTILFSLLSLLKGVPASESYGLIFGMIGASVAAIGFQSVNFNKVRLILIGLVFSIIGSVIITRVVDMCISHIILKLNVKMVKKLQIISCMGMSFAHGAQDGLKFIGILKLYEQIVTQNVMIQKDSIIVSLCAFTMALGTMIGGKRIIISVGKDLTSLNHQTALISEIGTIITLLLGNIFRTSIKYESRENHFMCQYWKRYQSQKTAKNATNMVFCFAILCRHVLFFYENSNINKFYLKRG